MLDRDGYAMLLAIGDFYHFYRTYADVLLEASMRPLDSVSSVKYHTLLMLAKEQGEEIIDGVVPESYFAEEMEHCPICKKAATDRSVFCDNCNLCFHMRCLKMKKEPKGHWYCEKCCRLCEKI